MSRSTIKDPAKSKSSETFFKVLRFIGRYRFLLIFSIILAAVSVILQLYVPILFGNAIDQVIAQHQVNFEMMWYYLSRILVMVILSSAATWLMNVINNRMTYQTVKDIRAKAIRHIQFPRRFPPQAPAWPLRWFLPWLAAVPFPPVRNGK